MNVEKANTGGPAFPLAPGTDPESAAATGATWVDVCAWHLAAGLLASPDAKYTKKQELARWAYEIAEQMLNEKQWREGGMK